ncbi:MAG TPA: glycoside hydrolase family 31 protein [Saprospiraceae bacterium]|nr:glycoside hydrolase family 31 protein [Saprospiraceae bacterium]HNT20443.1 glycoside hydrolase family 31 protein [Saprospiraceae bacterium]
MAKFFFLAMMGFTLWTAGLRAQSAQSLLNEPLDLSRDFRDYSNTYFLADSLASFDPAKASGQVLWRRAEYFPAHAFNYTQHGIRRTVQNEFPAREYAADPVWPFQLEFITPKTVRIRMNTGVSRVETDTLMIPGGRVASDKSWIYTRIEGGHQYKSQQGMVRIYEQPWGVEFFDHEGRPLTKTRHSSDNKGFCQTMPFCYVRRAADYSRSVGAVFTLSPDEKIFGCGESFTKLNKYGQKVNLYTCDPNGVETPGMYKPVPFFMSSRGYGMFMHTSTPITCDFGNSYGASNALWIGDEALDLFVFMGKPRDILDEYTRLTGKAPMPPLWSFGLWMSRITYFSEADGRNVAAKLRANRIPTDVLHFDTGWFETDWRCDYEFSKNRFPDARGMIADLDKDGFKTCLWQLPYFVPKNKLFPEIVDQGLHVKNAKGNIPFEDAVLDFTNPRTLDWYREKIGGLLRMGVAAIKVDFGEAAPFDGIYSNGRTGFYEHNLYPLRYNQVVSDLTQQLRNERIIWARSTWAGSQRYPLHWGGDAETSDMGMEAQLRGGLSLGLSGFTFWSHDIGGFTRRTPENLYRRWLPFGALSSHTRCHGQPPKEPWDYGEDFQNYFRKVIEIKYSLMPYIYTQSLMSSQAGLPMTRALLLEFPEDRGAWEIENQYLLGSDILVAPLFEEGRLSREVYLPAGKWIDMQDGRSYSGGWHRMSAGAVQAIILIRDGTVLPRLKAAQSTRDLDWSQVDLVVFSTSSEAKGMLAVPGETEIRNLKLIKKKKGFELAQEGLPVNVNFKIVPFEQALIK